MNALEHLNRVWDPPPPGDSGLGSLANRFQSLYAHIGRTRPGIGGKTPDQIVQNVAGPQAVSRLERAYEKLREAYDLRHRLNHRSWYDTPRYRELAQRRTEIKEGYAQRALALRQLQGDEQMAIYRAPGSQRRRDYDAYMSRKVSELDGRMGEYLAGLDQLMDSEYRYTFVPAPRSMTPSDYILMGGRREIDYGLWAERREVVKLRERRELQELAEGRAYWDPLGRISRMEGAMLRVERDLLLVDVEDDLREDRERYENLMRPQLEAAEEAYQEALAELNSASETLIERLDEATEVEYTLSAAPDTREPDDAAFGCLQFVNGGSYKCGKDLASDILDGVIQVTDSKAGKFYQKLREVLKKPEDEWTADDKIELARSVRDIFGDRAGALGKIADRLAQGYDTASTVVDFAKKVDAIVNRDPDDPLAELKAFRTYLGLGQTFADYVPGLGQMYEQYVEALDGIIANAGQIAKGTERKNRAIDWVDMVIEGRYERSDPEAEKAQLIFNRMSTSLGAIDAGMLAASSEGEIRLKDVDRRVIVKSTRKEREAYDEAVENYEKVYQETQKRMATVFSAVAPFEERLKLLVAQGDARAKAALADIVQLRREGEWFESPEDSDFDQTQKPGYNESVAQRIADIAGRFPRDRRMRQWASWAAGQKKRLVALTSDRIKADILRMRAQKRYETRLLHWTRYALSRKAEYPGA